MMVVILADIRTSDLGLRSAVILGGGKAGTDMDLIGFEAVVISILCRSLSNGTLSLGNTRGGKDKMGAPLSLDWT